MLTKTHNRILIVIAAVAAIPVVGAAVVTIGNNTGTPEQRCDRPWMSEEASFDCHQAIYDARSAAAQQSYEASARAVKETEARIRDTDAAMRDLQRRR